MAQKIQIRRGTDAGRLSVILDQGEPAYTTDTKKFFVGDGVTLGGNSLENLIFTNNESFTSFIPPSGSTATQNASGLFLAIKSSENKTPYGSGLAENNRYTIFVYPGIYDFTPYFASVAPFNEKRYVDVIGVGDKNDIVIRNIHTNAFSFLSGYAIYKNLTFHGGTTSLNVGNLIFDNVNFFNTATNLSALQTNSAFNLNKCIFKNINTSGGFLATDTIPTTVNECLISNSRFFGSKNFCAATSAGAPHKNNIVENCHIISPLSASPSFYSDLDGYAYDSTNLFKNCYISGENLMVDNGSSASLQARFSDCTFNGYISSFEGVMENCSIKGNNVTTQVPINVTNNFTYPCFYNCDIVSNHSNVSVTGTAITTSGLFAHSTFNKAVATGVTGRFGNQFNSIHSSFK